MANSKIVPLATSLGALSFIGQPALLTASQIPHLHAHCFCFNVTFDEEEVRYKGQWYPGKHEPLIESSTFDRVQQILGGAVYRSHELTYASQLITCGHCGRRITGEVIKKKLPWEIKEYRYYRCTRYTAPDHPRVRIREEVLDEPTLDILGHLRIEDDTVRDWFGRVLRERTRHQQKDTRERLSELNRQHTLVRNRQDQLLNLRLLEEIDKEAFACKSTELRDQVSKLTGLIEA